MGLLDRLLGREPARNQTGGDPDRLLRSAPEPSATAGRLGRDPTAGEDERALARYRYLLRTAPPEALEQVHADAFAQLSPTQRQQLLAELSRDLPVGEQPSADDPRSLARAATRAELRQPGYLERTLGRARPAGMGMGGMGMGGTIMGSLLGTIAGVVVGSAIAEALFDGYDGSPEAAEAGDSGGESAGGAAGDSGTESGGDGGSDIAGDPAGADYAGGEVGGGDFGGF